MQARIAAVQQKVANVTTEAQRLHGTAELRRQVSRPGTMTDDVIGIAGGNNINSNTTARYTKLTAEYVIGEDPQFIVLETQNTKTNDQVKNTTGYGTISAVVNDKIMRVDGAWLTASPRIVLAVEAFASWFHPELFPA